MSVMSIFALPLFCIFATGAVLAAAAVIKRLGPPNPASSEIVGGEIAAVHASDPRRNRLQILLSPVVLAVIVYLISLLLILLTPLESEYGIFFLLAVILLFSTYSAVSPVINLFLPRWWLNAVLFVGSWFLLFYGLLGTMLWRFGGAQADNSGLGIAFGLPMMMAGLVFPLTVLFKLIMAVRKASVINR